MTTTACELDTRGVDALSGQLDDNLLQPLIWFELTAELGELPQPPHIDPFDNEPWRKLPAIEELEYLWSTRDELIASIIHDLGVAAHGEGGGLSQYMVQQRQMAEWELKLKRAREASDAERADDDSAADGAAGLVSAETRRGGGDLPGGSQDGVAVGKGGKDRGKTNSRRSSKVSGGRGPGEVAG